MKRLTLALVVALGLAGCSSGSPVTDGAVDRLVIVSLPGVSWQDVESGALPNLRELSGEAAIGNLATRIGRREASLAAAYLTMGAATRAVAPPEAAGVALEPAELYHAEPAADVVARRLGHAHDGVAYLAVGAARDANARSAFGATVGTVGDALAAAGIHRAVVANGDIREGRLDDEAYGRSAVAFLMDASGMVDGGGVSRDLLTVDAEGAYGVALDPAVVVDAVDRALRHPRAVVLVEASDLPRASTYEDASADRRSALRSDALVAADELLGTVLGSIGPDVAVLVVSPVAPAGPDLAVVALRTPGGDHGLLRSATTRRDGYVQLADVGPTVLSVVGAEVPEDVEGRPFRVVSGSDGSLVGELAAAGALAEFRDEILPVAVTVFVLLLAVLTGLALVRRRLPRAVGRALPVAGAGVLGMVASTFLSARLGIESAAVFAVLLAGGGIAVAVGASLVDRRWPGAMPFVSVGAVLVLIAGDVVVGAPLQLNTVFGYSVAVAGRFAGVGNLAFALFAASALLFAALVAERHGRRGVQVALVVLGAALLIDGLPVLGADVGGVLSMVPAFGLAALVLLGRRIGLIEVVGVGAAAVLSLVVVAFADLARPEADRTHLARLAEHLVDQRWEPFANNLTRRWSASFGSGATGAWVVLALVVAVVGAYLFQRWVVGSGRFAVRGTLAVPERAAAIGLAVLATMGLVANDSSFAVPLTMLLVVVPVLLQRLRVAT
ncbi:MAG TPA: hypothetical protein VM262_14500 [Acidimicrobiales bacterium]|nr:hypothetical protein [Acidimicrobiales bacterium]